MVVAMRWMTRYLPFIARPFVTWYANREVIACGLRGQDGRVRVIFTPYPDRSEHWVERKRRGRWHKIESVPDTDFSRELVHQRLLPEVQIGDTVEVRSQRTTGRRLRSPSIVIKPETIRDDSILSVNTGDSSAKIIWSPPKHCTPMIYFLVVEAQGKTALSAIYTRERFWEYPKTRTASLSVGPKRPPALQADKEYRAKLVVVDFDGWVSCWAEQAFSV